MECQNELFFQASLEELKQGYVENKEDLECLVCSRKFLKGEIFFNKDHYYDAFMMIKHHIDEEHGTMLSYLLNMNSTFLGLSEVQHNVLHMISKGESDKEIAKKQGISPSTIRNHRYKLREREKQARLFLAMMELLKENVTKKVQVEATEFCDAPKTAKMIDDRYNITKEEKLKIIETYFDETGGLKEIPAKEKRKIIVLQEICKHFKVGKMYTEIEVNRIIKRIYSDFTYIRRLLIDYGYLERTNTGDKYWVRM